MTDPILSGHRALRRTALALAVTLLCAGSLQAQSLRPSSQLNPLRSQPATSGPRTVDFIVALVNSEPVTNNEVRQRLLRVEQQLTQQGAALPPRDELARQVLEQLVSERAQIQQAKELGIRVDEAALAQAEQAIAAQNQLSLEDFRRRLAAEGMDSNRVRNELSNQILLQRVREREVEARVQVTESDIDDYIREQRNSTAISDLQLNLAHVLVLVPESAEPARVAELQARAQQVADRARAGGEFAALAREFSDAPEKVNGGEFGLRPADRLPGLFVESTRNLRPGEIAGTGAQPGGFSRAQAAGKTPGRAARCDRHPDPRAPYPAARFATAHGTGSVRAAEPVPPANRVGCGQLSQPGPGTQPGRLGARRR